MTDKSQQAINDFIYWYADDLLYSAKSITKKSLNIRLKTLQYLIPDMSKGSLRDRVSKMYGQIYEIKDKSFT
jgi:hypothetical protein